MSSSTNTLDRTTVERLRNALVADLVMARKAHDRAKIAYGAPYASNGTIVAFHQARGRWEGAGRAVETFDRLTGHGA